MKRIIFILLISISHQVFAQLKATLNDVVLVKEVAVKKFRGMDYIITADVKSLIVNNEGKIGLTSLQVGKTDWDFLEKTRRAVQGLKNNQDWHQVTISGKVDVNATKLWINLLTYGNGDFYFDNIKLKVKISDDIWQNVDVRNGDFESSTSKNPLAGLRNIESLSKKKDVKVNVIVDSQYNKVLHIQSQNAKPDERIFYGYNKRAGKYVNVNGIKLYYESYGDGEPLILLHGNGGSINSFLNQIPDFSRKYKVIVIDTRGQGNSRDSTSLSFSYHQFADDVKVLLDSLHLKKVNLLGWSDGGNSALILASEYPEYVSKLVVVGANLNSSAEAVNKKILTSVKKDIEKIKAGDNGVDKVDIRLLEMLLREPNIDPQYLNSITAKTMVMAGENDIILEKHTRLIANSIPNAGLNIVKRQNHYMVQENPALFNAEVLRFFEK